MYEITLQFNLLANIPTAEINHECELNNANEEEMSVFLLLISYTKATKIYF